MSVKKIKSKQKHAILHNVTSMIGIVAMPDTHKEIYRTLTTLKEEMQNEIRLCDIKCKLYGNTTKTLMYTDNLDAELIILLAHTQELQYENEELHLFYEDCLKDFEEMLDDVLEESFNITNSEHKYVRKY